MGTATLFTYLALINYCIQFAMTGIAWVLSLCLLRYNHKFNKTLSFSPTMLLYFIFVFISSFQIFWHALYEIIFWRPQGNIADPVYTYIAGAISSQLQATVPLIEVFVCFDRIFTVLCTGKYISYKRYIPFIAAITSAFGLQFGYNYAYDFVGGIPYPNKPGVILIYQKNGAMIYSIIKKATVALCSFFATIYFYIILRKIKFNSQRATKLNKAILSMLVVSIFTDFLPNLLYGVGMIVAGRSNFH